MKSKNLSGIQVICSPCPLISKIPTLNNPLARRCGEIIENARHIWGYLSPEEQSVYYEVIDGEEVPKKFPPYSNFKLTSARSIRNWYVEHSDLMLTNQKTPEAIRKAVQDVRRYARPGIDNDITDKEILAIFAICEAFDAIHSIQQGKPEEAIKEKVLSASMFLNLAKTGFEPEKQASNPKAICFPIPSGIEISGVKMVFLDDENVRITINGESRSFHYVEMGFSHKVNKEPLEMWNTLLEYAEYNGVLRSVVFKKQKDSERINEKLKSFFVTNDDLIRANKTVFNISRKTGKKQKPINIQSKECPSCHETHRHFCFTCNDEQEHCKECHNELYKETHTKLSK